MTRQQIKEKFNAITIWKRGHERAPHKPLLILYALGQYSRNGNRLISYKNSEKALKELLEEFGPFRKSYRPYYPFGRLRNDGIWELTNTKYLQGQSPQSDLKVSELIEFNVHGGVSERIYEILRKDQKLLWEIADNILEAHFPPTYHDDIRAAVGLTESLNTTFRTYRRRYRDPKFRDSVLFAYEQKCAICGFDVRVGHRPVALEAAHIKWHQAGGPDEVSNGLALCIMHHKLLDKGAMSISFEGRIMISKKAYGTQGFEEWLLRFNGEKLFEPTNVAYEPFPEYLKWHQKEVFKAPMRN